MLIKKFEDLDCWKQARILVSKIYLISSKNGFERDFGLKDQIRRSSVSVLSNVAEGFESFSTVEFIRFLNYAIRSASEVQSQLYVALDVGYVKNVEFEELYQSAESCRRLCRGLTKYLRENSKSKNSQPANP